VVKLFIIFYIFLCFQYNQGPAFEPFAVQDMPHMHRIVYDMYQEIVAEMNAQQQQVPYDHRRTRQGGGGGDNCPPNFEKPWKFGQMLGKIKKIRADLSENMLKSRYFITILHKNSGKLSTPPPPPRKTSESRSPMSMTICT
jgi:hypothetical protein